MSRAVYHGKSLGSSHTLEIAEKEVIIMTSNIWDDKQDRIPIHAIDAVSITRSMSTAGKFVLYALVLSSVWMALANIFLWNVLEARDLLLMLVLGVTFLLAAVLLYILGRPTRIVVRSVSGTPYDALYVGALEEKTVTEIVEAITAMLPPR